MKVYIVQHRSTPLDKSANFERVRSLISRTPIEPGGLILLPEMFATGYLPENPEQYAEDFRRSDSGETAAFLSQMADATGCTLMGAGIQKIADKLTNHVTVYQPERKTEYAFYDKIHPFFPEQGKFTPGEGVTLFEMNDFTVAPTLCYDLRFPETYRSATRQGATLLTVQAAWPAQRKEHWKTLLKARAIENQAFVAAVNVVSEDGSYSGDSMVIAPDGNIINCAPEGKEIVIEAPIDAQFLHNLRQQFPVLRMI